MCKTLGFVVRYLISSACLNISLLKLFTLIVLHLWGILGRF
jgi:hypothetical protein